MKSFNERRFRIALTIAGISLSRFARKNRCTPAAVVRVLQGKTKSARLEKACDMFIRNELEKLHILGDS